MPMADDLGGTDHLLRAFLYGVGKTKKTWWACLCAELGLNVILLDGDDGSAIVRQLPTEVRKKILVLHLATKSDRPVFVRFMASFLKPKNKMVWDEEDRAEAMGLRNVAHAHVELNADRLTHNDVIVLDSWTALVDSLKQQYALENKIDLSDAERTDWGGFNYEGNFLNWVLMRIHALPCHLIVIGHESVYEKWDRRSKNPKDHVIVEQRVQPMSSSGPHGKKLAKHFTDILYFQRQSGEVVYIDTAGDRDRDGGSRLIAPKKVNWDKLGPGEFFKALEFKADPTAKCAGAVWCPPGAPIANGAGSAAHQQSVNSVNSGTEVPTPPSAISPKVVSGGFLSKIKMGSNTGG